MGAFAGGFGMWQVATLNEAFLKISGRGDKVVWRWQDKDGAWKPIAAADAYGRVRALATALAGWGVGKGDRVAMLSENRWEWPVTDFAVLALGAVDVPLYLTLTAEQVGYMLRDSGAKVAVVSNREQYDKLLAAGDLPALEQVVVMDGEPKQDVGHPRPFQTHSFTELMQPAAAMRERDAAFDARVREVKPEDLATIIYTSGTTGEPKGVRPTHGNAVRQYHDFHSAVRV